MIFGKRNRKSVGVVVADSNKNVFIRKIIRKMSTKKDLNNSKKSSSSSASLSPSSSSSSTTSSNNNSEHHQQQDQEQEQDQQGLSKLPTMMSKFIVESARKTHDSIVDEEGRKEFLLILRDEMRSEVIAPLGNYQKKQKQQDTTSNEEQRQEQVRDDNDDNKEEEEEESSSSSSTTSTMSNDNPSPVSSSSRKRDSMNVIDFLVKASQGTLESMTQEDERNAFKQHLRRSLQKEFIPSTITLYS